MMTSGLRRSRDSSVTISEPGRISALDELNDSQRPARKHVAGKRSVRARAGDRDEIAL